MRKNLVKGMAALAICAAFASCSHDTDFEASNQEFTVENLKNEYKVAFEQKYGKVDPNQSWDFTGFTASARTRGTLSNIGMDWILNGYGNSEIYGMTVKQM